MFPYNHLLATINGRTNQSSDVVDCTVNDTDSFFSSCIFTFTFYYLLPLAIIGLSYSRVLIHVRRTGYSIAKRMVSNKFSSISTEITRWSLWESSIDQSWYDSFTSQIGLPFLLSDSSQKIESIDWEMMIYILVRPASTIGGLERTSCSTHATWSDTRFRSLLATDSSAGIIVLLAHSLGCLLCRPCAYFECCSRHRSWFIILELLFESFSLCYPQ